MFTDMGLKHTIKRDSSKIWIRYKFISSKIKIQHIYKIKSHDSHNKRHQSKLKKNVECSRTIGSQVNTMAALLVLMIACMEMEWLLELLS